MGKKGYVMDEVMPPCSERRCLIPENLAIPQDPNFPSCCKDHFSEENMPKILPSLYSHVVGGHPRLRIPCLLWLSYKNRLLWPLEKHRKRTAVTTSKQLNKTIRK